jgi:hypothetical protein
MLWCWGDIASIRRPMAQRPRHLPSRGRGREMARSPRSFRPLFSEISFRSLGDLLGHDARVAEAVDEQRPCLGRQAGVGTVAALGPEGHDVDAGARRRPAHACVERAGRLRLDGLGLFDSACLGGGAQAEIHPQGTCYVLRATCYLLLATCHLPHATSYLLHATCDLRLATC